MLSRLRHPCSPTIRLQRLFLCVVKRATLLFNSFWSNVAKQVARVLLPQFGLKLGEGAGPPGPSPGSAAA